MTRTRSKTLAAALAGLGAALAAAPVAAQSPAPAPCEGGLYDDFDFWIGAWDVATPDGAPAGRNVITRAEGGCLLIERWTSVGGGTGQSYNYVDPASGKWRQIWVSGAATIDYAGGLNDQGEMALEGEIAYRNGVVAPFRGVWTPREDGSVRQHFEQYDAETGAWTAWFTGLYTRAEAPAE